MDIKITPAYDFRQEKVLEVNRKEYRILKYWSKTPEFLKYAEEYS